MNKRPSGLVNIACPLCLGTGTIKRRLGARHSYSFEIKKKATDLYREGMTLRAIAKIVGVKNPQSVQSMIDSYVKMAADITAQ